MVGHCIPELLAKWWRYLGRYQGKHPPFEANHGQAGEKLLASFINMDALHKLMHVNLAVLAADLKNNFGGVWEHCYPGTGAYALNNPFFNSHGDIWFELCRYAVHTQASTPGPKSRPSVKVNMLGDPRAAPVQPTIAKPKSRTCLSQYSYEHSTNCPP